MNEIREEVRRMRATGEWIVFAIAVILSLAVVAAGIYFVSGRSGGDAQYASQAVQGVVCLDMDGDGRADAIMGQRGTVFIPPEGKARVFPCPSAPREAIFRSGGWAGVDWAFWTSEQGK